MYDGIGGMRFRPPMPGMFMSVAVSRRAVAPTGGVFIPGMSGMVGDAGRVARFGVPAVPRRIVRWALESPIRIESGIAFCAVAGQPHTSKATV
jgi:hypothetical protein